MVGTMGSWKRLDGLRETLGALWDALVLGVARGAVDAVRYQPRHLDLVVASEAGLLLDRMRAYAPPRGLRRWIGPEET